MLMCHMQIYRYVHFYIFIRYVGLFCGICRALLQISADIRLCAICRCIDMYISIYSDLCVVEYIEMYIYIHLEYIEYKYIETYTSDV